MSNGLNLHSNGAKTKFGFSCGYEFGNRLLLPKTSDKVEVGYIFESVPLKFDPSRPKLNLWNKRYISFNGYFYVVLISLALLAVVLTFWIRERFKNRKSTVFTEEQRAFLVSLSSEPMRTEALNELLGLLESSWEIQRRKRSDFIKALNEQGLNSLGKEIILREKSIEDKRQVLYVLNEEVRSELARLM
jgi:hypothetical protein